MSLRHAPGPSRFPGSGPPSRPARPPSRSLAHVRIRVPRRRRRYRDEQPVLLQSLALERGGRDSRRRARARRADAAHRADRVGQDHDHAGHLRIAGAEHPRALPPVPESQLPRIRQLPAYDAPGRGRDRRRGQQGRRPAGVPLRAGQARRDRRRLHRRGAQPRTGRAADAAQALALRHAGGRARRGPAVRADRERGHARDHRRSRVRRGAREDRDRPYAALLQPRRAEAVPAQAPRPHRPDDRRADHRGRHRGDGALYRRQSAPDRHDLLPRHALRRREPGPLHRRRDDPRGGRGADALARRRGLLGRGGRGRRRALLGGRDRRRRAPRRPRRSRYRPPDRDDLRGDPGGGRDHGFHAQGRG